MIQLVIFDWDGTLADSAGPIVRAMQAAILAMELPPREDAAIRDLIGLSWQDALVRLYPDIDHADALRRIAEYRRRVPPLEAQTSPLFKGVTTALSGLQRDGYRLAVATGKPRAGLNQALRTHDVLRPLFMATRCADETASKPDPRMLKEILRATGCGASEALMVGDSEYDVEMARAIDMRVLGVGCGVHEPGRLLRAGAVAVVDDIVAAALWIRAAV